MTVLNVTDDGWHPCVNCGHMWWATVVTLTKDAKPAAWSLDAYCQACGWPLLLETTGDDTP